ncbi:MAG: hypothetical protein CMM27_12915 [Rhodospirillaceae bacterium]|nr:hypothetical protein [Rhodospirillaceae bacterium]
MKKSKYIHDVTPEAALEVASNLRPDDLREVVEGHGLDPMLSIPFMSLVGFCKSFTVPNGRTAGLVGIQDGGLVWMLTTSAIHDYPITFAREAKRFIESRDEPLLWNIVDKRNTVHLKLLKFLGFKFLREVTYGPNNLSFIEFCRVFSNSRSSN